VVTPALVVPPVLVPLMLEPPPVEVLDELTVPPVGPFGLVEFWVAAAPPPAELQAVTERATPSEPRMQKFLIDSLD